MPAKRIIVTGSAGGMGSVACRLLAGRGANIVAVDRDAKRLEQVARELSGVGGEVLTAVADVSNYRDVAAYVDLALGTWGGVDGAFHIAGDAGRLKSFAEADLEEFDEMIASNARSVWYGMKALLPVFLNQGGGAIVNTGSYAAIRGGRFTAAYAAAKHAVVGLTRCMAVEYGGVNIRCNVVAPGSMDTPMAREMAAKISPGDTEAGLRRMAERIPKGRMARTDEVASVGVWLLLDAPEHLSGQVIPVDGARSAG
jgi:3alpha(or 20beta)-hydroxysteroid dehydrogenase